MTLKEYFLWIWQKNPHKKQKTVGTLLHNPNLYVSLQSKLNMVPIVQLVRASDCGSECRGFESHWAPKKRKSKGFLFFVLSTSESPHGLSKRFKTFHKKKKIQDFVTIISPTHAIQIDLTEKRHEDQGTLHG